jgi:hypothetical protein
MPIAARASRSFTRAKPAGKGEKRVEDGIRLAVEIENRLTSSSQSDADLEDPEGLAAARQRSSAR